MEDVRLVDRSTDTGELLVLGPDAAAALERSLGLGGATRLEPLGGKVVTGGALAGGAGDGETILLRVGGGFALIAPRERIASMKERLVGAGLPELDLEAQEAMRVEDGVPRWGAELDLDTIPIEAGLEAAISYDKGCYTGNEVMARIRTYGHVNRHLRGLLPEAEVAAGATVRAGDRAAGVVTSVAHSPTLGRPLALAMLRREAAEPGGKLEVLDGDGQPVAAEVTALPFVRRER
jgi:folate-binding protein YgfZ